MRQLLETDHFNAGISEASDEGPSGSFFFGQNLNIYGDPGVVTLNPKTIKDSGTTVTNLVKWITSGTPYDTNTYFYDAGGNIYKRTSAGVYSNIRAVANSDGQGMDLYGGTSTGNNYLYYTQRTQLGRYGPLDGVATFTDNWQISLNDTTSTKFAPVKAFQSGLAVGHGNNLAWYDGSVWTLTKLTFPPGFNVRSLDIVDEFLAITCWRGTSITASEESYVFFWNGTSTTYDFFIKVEEGAVNGTVNSNNRLLGIVGSSGSICQLYPQFQKIQILPKLKQGNYAEVYPGALTNWKNIVHIGTAGATDSTDLVQGVYQYGRITNRYPEALNFGYTLSTGEITGTVMAVGAVKGIGNQLFISWKKSDGTYGIDRVLQTNAPFATGSIEFLIFDNNTPMMEKLADIFKISHLALKSGESMQLGYKIDRASSYTTDTANSTLNDITTKLPMDLKTARFHEIQGEVVFGAGSTAPTLTGWSLKFDDLLVEASSGKR